MKRKATKKQKRFVDYVQPKLKNAEFVQVIRCSKLEPNGSETFGTHAPVMGHHSSR